MPTRTKTKQSQVKHTPKNTLEVLPSAPLVPGMKLPKAEKKSAKKAQRAAAFHAGKARGKHHITIVQKHSTKVAVHVSHGYKVADAKLLSSAAKIIPAKTREQLARNRADNNGNLKVPLPIKPGHKVHLTVPAWLRHARHAVLPTSLILLLFLTILPAGASPPDYAGTFRFGGSGSDQGKAITADSSGNTFLGGSFAGTVTFDDDFTGSPTDTKSAGSTTSGAFITKTNSDGSYGWTHTFAGTEANAVVAVTHATTDSSGNIFVTGTFRGTDALDDPSAVDFRADWGGGTDIHTSDTSDKLFVTKINSDGSYGWTRSIGDGSTNTLHSPRIVTDATGDIYIGGGFTGDVIFDDNFSGSPIDTKTNAGGQDGFVTKVESDNTYGWTRHFGSTQSDTVSSVIMNGTTVLAAGDFGGTLDFAASFDGEDPDSKVATGSDGFITSFSNDGTDYLESRQVGGSGNANIANMHLAGSILYISGNFSGAATFGSAWSTSANRTARGTQDAFILRLPGSGSSFDAAYQFGATSQTVSAAGVVVDSNNMAYLAGTYTGTVDFGQDFASGTPQTSYGATSGYLLSFSKLSGEPGSYDWTRSYGAAEPDDPAGAVSIAAITLSGEEVYATGDFSETINFSNSYTGTDNKSASSSDIFRTQITAGPAHTISAGSGLRVEDNQAVNLGITGTRISYPAVNILDDDNDAVLIRGRINLTTNRTWAGSSGDSNLLTHKMVINGIYDADGFDNSTYELYVPRGPSDTAVVICPEAVDLDDVIATCEGRQTFSMNDFGVNQITIGSVDYWRLTNVADTSVGGMSIDAPGLTIVQSDGSTTSVEGGADDSFTLKLDAAPNDEVIVTFTSDPSGQIADINPIYFSPGDWNDAQTIYITAVDDGVVEGAHAVDLDYSISSNDSLYGGATGSSVLTANITDNDTAGVTWSTTGVTTSESDAPGGGATSEVCLQLTAEPGSSVTFNLASSDTGEVVLEDSSIVIAPGDWDGTENCAGVRGVADTIVDGPQQVDISINSITGDGHFAGLDTGSLDTASVTNQDTDSANLIVTTPDGTTTTEAGGEAQLCVALTASPATGSVTIPVSAPGVVSLSSNSFVLSSSDWDTGECITLTGQDDDIINATTSYSITPGTITAADTAWQGVSTSGISSISFTNTDDDTAELVINETALSASEGGAGDSFTVRLNSEPQAGKQVVVAVTANNTSQLTVDSGNTLTFTPADWDTPQTVTISADDDSLLEGSHESDITVAIHNTTDDTDYDGLTNESLTTTITDNDTATASIAATADATENAAGDPGLNGSFRISLSKTNNTGSNVTVTYTIGGSAVNGTHYNTLGTTAQVANGASYIDVPISVIGRNNALLQGNKTVLLTLTNTSHGAVTIDTGNDDASVTIFDDESATASLSVTQQGLEAGPQPIIFTATLSSANQTGSDITFSLTATGGSASGGSDYDSLAAGVITIPSGATSGDLEVAVTDDSLLEAVTETIDVELANSSHPQVSINGSNDTAQATITDNDTATVALSAPVNTTTEGSATVGQFAITLNKTNNTSSDITVNYTVAGTAVAGTDYTALTGSAVIATGQTAATIDVNADDYDNLLRQADKTVILTYASTSLGGRIALSGGTATVTILDNEIAAITGNVTGTTNESGATAQVCFELASQPSGNVTVPVTSSDTDKITLGSANVVITPPNWNQPNNNCVTATGVDDSPPLVTGDTTVSIVTGNPTSSDTFYDALGASDIADLDITHQDNDTAAVQVSLLGGLDETSEDGTQTVVLRMTLTTEPTDDVTVPVTLSDASEGSFIDSGSDIAENIVITPSNWNNAAANELIIYGVDDALTDGDTGYTVESGTATSSDTGYNNLATGISFNLTNIDDDTAGVAITQSGGTTAVTEGAATDTIAVALTSQPAGSNTAVITATPANNQLDIGAGAGQPVDLTFVAADWDQAQTITITANDDSLLEGTHSALVQFAIDTTASTEPSYQSYSGSVSPATVTITDNDTATADLSSAQNGNEAGPVSSRFTVTLSEPNNTGSALTFQLNPTGGSATSGTDYTNFAGTTVSVANGATTSSVNVTTIDDALLESDETIQATLSASSLPAVTISTATASGTIIDNDTATVNIVASQPSAIENPETNGQFTVSLSKVNNTGSGVTVNYTVAGTATSGDDYAALSGTAEIANGQSNTTITVDVGGYDDVTIEPNESVIATITSTSDPSVSLGSPTVATVTIADDDSFTWNIAKTQDGNEDGSEPIEFTVTLSKPNATGNDLTATLGLQNGSTASEDEDYDAFDGDTVTIPNGGTSTVISIPVTDDTDLEGSESVGVTLSSPSDGSLGTTTATASIADNETADITIEATDATAAESPSDNGEFTLSLSKVNKSSGPLIIGYTINGTATNGQDYAQLSGTAMIATGQDTTTINVVTAGKDDAAHEGSETVLIALVSASIANVTVGTPNNATVTISDNDPAPAETPGTTPVATTKKSSPTVVQPIPDQSIPTITQPTIPVDQLPKDADNDDIVDTEEAKAQNNGDGNGDGIPDSTQKNVASRISPVTSRPITLEAEGDCQTITSFTTVSQSSLAKSDTRYTYPEGLVDFKLLCTDIAQKSNVTVYYDKILTGDATWRKFLKSNGGEFSSVLAVQLSSQLVGNQMVSTAHYTVTDGGILDDDGKADGMIKDPAGLATERFYAWDKLWVLLPVVFIVWLILHLHHKRHHARQHIRKLRNEVVRNRRN